MTDKAKRLQCICQAESCWRGPDIGVPAYCQARDYTQAIEMAAKAYTRAEYADIYRAAAIVSTRQEGMRPRVVEALDFCRTMGFTKIGVAVCSSQKIELELLVRLFNENGLEVVTANCQIGRVSAEARGMPELAEYGNSACNPLAQAEVLAAAGTQFNFQMGLCMGHDVLFNMHSKAPVSTLIVKDRATGNNPAAVFHGWHLKRSLFNLDRWDGEEL